MVKDYSNAYRQSFDFVLHQIKKGVESGINAGNEKMLLATLDQAFDFNSCMHTEGVFPELKRLTINRQILGTNKRIEDIKFLKYPPPELVKSYGRCNIPGQSVLYASSGMLNIVSEMKPKLGDLITISTWIPKENCSLSFYPIFFNQPTDGTINLTMHNYMKDFQRLNNDNPPNFRYMLEKLTSFIADSFSRRFPHNSNDLNYLVSAYYANKMLNEYNNGKIDAIFYPSVQQKLAFENIAIKPNVFDEKYELVEVDQSIVVMVPDHKESGYFTEGISDCKKFDFETGKILWDKKYITPYGTPDHYIKHFGYQE